MYDSFTFPFLVRFYYNEFVLIAKKINVCFIKMFVLLLLCIDGAENNKSCLTKILFD